jgi:hypothetical protein
VCRSVRDKYANLAESIIRADSFLFPRSFLRIDQFIYIATSRPTALLAMSTSQHAEPLRSFDLVKCLP